MCVFGQDLGYAHSAHRGSPYLRMRRGRRPTVSIVNGCRHVGKGDGPGAPLGPRRGHGGRTLPPSLNPQEGMTKRRMKMERRGRWSHLPIHRCLRTFPCLVTSSASKWGSPLVRVGRDDRTWRPGHWPACRRSPTSHWYLLTYRGWVLWRWWQW
jgi:hypothetical protein